MFFFLKMDKSKLILTSSLMYLCKNESIDLFVDDSDEELDKEVSTILQKFVTVPRVSVINFFEETVTAFSDDEFVRFFRVSRDVFKDLAEMYSKSDVYEDIISQHLVSLPAKSLAVFLWFCGHECVSYRDVSNLFNISISTVHSIIRRTISFISSLAPIYIKWPTVEEMKLESDYHFRKYGIPGVIGAVDGTHIVIDPPKGHKDEYLDRKGDVSLLVQAVCNHENKFIHVSIGYPGSVHDARAFRCSVLPEKLQALPKDFLLLGDSAYPLSEKLLTPYRDNGHLSAAQKFFNNRLSKSRVMIENSFGILKQRFRQLYYCKLKGHKTLSHFIRACFVLHNICKSSDLKLLGIDPEAKDTPYPHAVCTSNNNPDKNADKAKRNEICAALYRRKARPEVESQ